MPPPWDRNFFHRKNKLSYDYPNYYNQYIVTTAVIGEEFGIMLRWDRNDMQSITEEKNLQAGDKVDLFFIVPNDGGGHWSAGGYQYVITEYGWEKIGYIIGE